MISYLNMMSDQVPAAGWFRFNVRQANCNWYYWRLNNVDHGMVINS